MLRKHTSDPQIGTFLSSVDWPNASDASVRRDDLGSNAGDAVTRMTMLGG